MTENATSQSIADYINSSCPNLICTCDTHPRILHYNNKMQRYLYFESEDPNWKSFIEESFFNVIPHSDWPYLTDKLKTVITTEKASLIRHSLIRNDGSIIALTGWAGVYHLPDGSRQLAFLYLSHDISHKTGFFECTDTYLSAFRDMCNMVFEIDILSDTVKCLYSRPSYTDCSLRLCKSSSEFINLWLNDYVLSSDYEIMKAFFDRICSFSSECTCHSQVQAEFRSKWNSFEPVCMTASAIRLQSSDIMVCFGDTPDYSYRNTPVNAHPLKNSCGQSDKNIYISTFDHFDIFVNNIPIGFSNPKEKELLAILVDRNGGSITTNEAVEILWENEPVNERLKTRYRKLVMKLKQTLESYNLGNLLVCGRGIRSLNKEPVICDYFELQKGNEYYKKHFHNTYLSDYSWAETTLASLIMLQSR